ncbi:MAG: hypothetical protein ACREH9_04485 [Pseudomonadota bacterium]
MGSRSRDTFKKRQKEVARAEKQQEKAARRMQRKAQKSNPEAAGPETGDDPDSIIREELAPGEREPGESAFPG